MAVAPASAVGSSSGSSEVASEVPGDRPDEDGTDDVRAARDEAAVRLDPAGAALTEQADSR